MDYSVIKEDDFFLITDRNGDIEQHNSSGYGFYTKDTRFLSRMELFINEQKPILLSSKMEPYAATILLTNPHMENEGNIVLWRESVEIKRVRFINKGVLYERISFTNFSPKAVAFTTSLLFDADFHDMFIVRGFQSGKTGSKTGIKTESNELRLAYKGIDEVLRETIVHWDRSADQFDDGKVTFNIKLEPREKTNITFRHVASIDGQSPQLLPFEKALTSLRLSYDSWNANATHIESDHALFNKLFNQGLQDLRMLITDIGHGNFPVAGVPWFVVPFGRDSIITALQMLPLNSDIAKGTLFTMAAYQGDKVDSWRDEQPGKIMHEIRYGELANSNQIPFTPYYGTIDATPLFLVLAAQYYHWTEDLGTLQKLLPHIERAIDWINKYGDRDGDFFIEYYQESSKGIANQGWKDSGDSIVHKNGEYAKAPIALVEVQGYVYQAKTQLSPILRKLGKDELADKLDQEAHELKKRFNEKFWMPEEQFFAIALDHEKQQVQSVTSNPGHLLMSGIIDEEKARKVANRLVQPDMFSGYGIRTMSTQSTGYNPMSYHDGSIWPHDNSIALLGLGMMGYQEEALTVISGLMKASDCFENQRLPELFCGYDEELGYPVPYPVACSPQAWAAGTSIVILQAILGIWPDGDNRKVTLRPNLPAGMNRLTVKGMKIGEGQLDITVFRNDGELKVEVIKNSTGYAIEC